MKESDLSPTKSAPLQRGAFNLDEFLPYRLSCAQKAVEKLIQTTYERHFALSDLQWHIIAALSWGEPRTQRDLCAMTGADKVAVNRAVQTLDERGLVLRHYGKIDRRSHLLTLTEQGEALSDRIQAKALEISSSLLSQLDEPERSTLKNALRRLQATANDLRSDDEAKAVELSPP